MHGISRCEICEKEFKWRKRNCDKPARFCSFNCKIQGKFRTRIKNSERSNEEKTNRIKLYFEKYVIKKDGCWEWKGIIEKTGYGVLGVRPPLKAHRASWIIYRGDIPKGMCVLHSCDNRQCANPEHLWIGTHKQNTEDKILKGRSNTPKGSELTQSKISEEDAKKIKIYLSQGKSCSGIGKEFGISRKIVSRIKNGETWKHVEIEDNPQQ